MRTLRISGGDLVLAGGAYATLEGAARVAQDLRMALGEPLGNDRFHPGWGSLLSTYIGLPLSGTQFDVEQEVGRVVGAYAAVQRDKIAADSLSGARSRYTTADVLASTSEARVTSHLSTVEVSIAIRTVGGQQEVLTTEVGG